MKRPFLPSIGEMAGDRPDAARLRRELGIEQETVPTPVYCFGCLSRDPDTLTPCPNPNVTGDWLCPRCIREGRDSKRTVARLQAFCVICGRVDTVNTVRDDGEWVCDEHLAAPNVRPKRPVKAKRLIAGRNIDTVKDADGDEPGAEEHRRDTERPVPPPRQRSSRGR